MSEAPASPEVASGRHQPLQLSKKFCTRMSRMGAVASPSASGSPRGARNHVGDEVAAEYLRHYASGVKASRGADMASLSGYAPRPRLPTGHRACPARCPDRSSFED